jgi:glycosyltransferase involved in cell wall biosynthesis
VKECVQSILAQSLPQFNLHILDNASNDGTLEWLGSINDYRIVIIPSEKPLSMEENWGRIMSIPRNEFMTIIGHDDILDKEYLARMEKLIREDPSASLYQSHFRFIDDNGKMIRSCKPMESRQTAPEFLEAILQDKLDTMGTGYLMRSSDYDRVGGIPPYPNLLFADHALWISLCRVDHEATTREESFSFRLHRSVSRNTAAAQYIKAYFLFIGYLKELADQDEALNKIIRANIISYMNYYCRSLTHRLLKTPVSQREGWTIESFIRKCKEFAGILVPGNDWDPYAQSNIRLARRIDNNTALRSLYLLFRRVYKKPIYS